jgi:hypothetical protein
MFAYEKIKRAVEKRDQERLVRQAEETSEYKRFVRDKALRDEFLSYCREATALDYAEWLEGYLIDGDVSHVYDYPMSNRGITLTDDGWAPADASWLVLMRDGAVLPEFYGASSVYVIVPAHLTLTLESVTFHGCSGHNSIYYMDGYTKLTDWVPVYPDVAEYLVNKQSIMRVPSTRRNELE